MADEPRRIIDLTETQLVGSGDYLALDSADGGTKKVKASYFSGSSENYMWGGIQGDIADQTDLYAYLEQIPNKADIDGYYEDMSVGSAEQLLSNTYESDSAPYLYRTSGGSIEIGNRVYEDAIVGGSVVWNQLVDTSTTTVPTISGRKYLTVINDIQTIINGDGTSISVTGGTDNVHDLTLMFGSSVADYIYSLEQATAGSGVALFRSYYPKTNYEYNAGSIESVKTSAKKVVGFNQWDEQWEVGYIDSQGNNTVSSVNIRSKNFISIKPNTRYYLKSGYAKVVYCPVFFYDANKTFLSANLQQIWNTVITTPPNAKYIRFYMNSAYGNVYNHDICINLHWDGERDGQYEPYEEKTYPLDSDLELRGIPKLDTNNKLYYDGDVYESDGTVTRKYGIVDLGSLTWQANTTGTADKYRMKASISGLKMASSASAKANLVCSKYLNVSGTDTYSLVVGICTSHTEAAIFVYDSNYDTITSASAFKTAMDGIYLVYELATPTTESADPYINPQWVDNWGTEEFVDEREVPVPVGHDSRYLPDLKAKLESAPSNPSTNGKYFLQYQNGEATYVPVPSEVPQTPTTDGTYVLKATVTSGTATLSWVAEE